MSDWIIRDWRVSPRSRYSFAFLAIALVVSGALLGAAVVSVPANGAFDDDHVLQVAENRLNAVEALWVDGKIYLEDIDGYNHDPLEGMFPTDDPSVRWLVDSYFKLTARNNELMTKGWYYNQGYRLDGLAETIDDKFGDVTYVGTYCAWELVLNGTTVHRGSNVMEGAHNMPESHWTVSHDYSGEVQWSRHRGMVPFQAKLVFHLWFETERPEF